VELALVGVVAPQGRAPRSRDHRRRSHATRRARARSPGRPADDDDLADPLRREVAA
jgi:hypothetical protein